MTSSVQDEPTGSPDTTSQLESASPSRFLAETVVARVALGVIALHVADDNYLQPQPGTSVGDHLVSGFVPLAVLALAAWGYPRIRAGFRAVVALTLGLFGIVAGVEAIYYSTKGGPSGDDFTGFLSIAAGLVLFGVAVVTLWRTRRTDDRRWWRYLRRLLIASVGSLSPRTWSFPAVHLVRRDACGTRVRPRA